MTAQAADVLIYRSEPLPLFTNPLELYFDGEHPRPRFTFPHTGLWRGYIATWEIREDRLWLVNIEGSVLLDGSGRIATSTKHSMCETLVIPSPEVLTRPVTLADIFPDHSGPVMATWFLGELRIPEGELVQYVHMGYSSVYEYERVITIDQGRVLKEERINAGEMFQKKLADRALQLALKRPAQLRENGWTTCPHCGKNFDIRNAKRWDGEHHTTCGGRIELQGRT